MKILVLSDSHSSLQFMRRCVLTVRPDAIIHLGDYYDDGQILAEENPHLTVHQVPGNCDRYRCPPFARAVLNYKIGGVSLYMTHGHQHYVKSSISLLLSDARKAGAKAALFGHTHQAECFQEPDGLWVLNPGSAGYGGGSAGIIETDGENITACYLMDYRDLEALL